MKEPIRDIWIETVHKTHGKTIVRVIIWRGTQLSGSFYHGTDWREISTHSVKRARRAFKALKTKKKGGEK